MTKLESYESALTLYGKIFSRLSGKSACYFLGTIKRDFVFFLFALIWKGAGGASALKSKSRLLPRNFNEWTFGQNRVVNAPKTDSALWNIDRVYFHDNPDAKRVTEGLLILGCGIDFEKHFTLENLGNTKEVRAIVDWTKKPRFGGIQVLIFFLENLASLCRAQRILAQRCALKCSLMAFLRYFVYYAFASARIRAMIWRAAKNKDIGKVMSSDLSNVIGNSFILWSNFYGLSQIAYPHGSPLFLDKDRYFEPEEYYIWTIYQKNYAVHTSGGKQMNFARHPPKWAEHPRPPLVLKNKIRQITIITSMEENLEIPFGDREKLISYIEAIAQFAASKDISVYIKSHKLLDWHDDYDALSKKYGNVTHVKKRWRTEQLENIDIGILMNTSTTMALQLLSLGIPVVTCKDVMSEIVHAHFCAPYFPDIAESKENVLRILETLIRSNESYKQAQIKAREAFFAAIHI